MGMIIILVVLNSFIKVKGPIKQQFSRSMTKAKPEWYFRRERAWKSPTCITAGFALGLK